MLKRYWNDQGIAQAILAVLSLLPTFAYAVWRIVSRVEGRPRGSVLIDLFLLVVCILIIWYLRRINIAVRLDEQSVDAWSLLGSTAVPRASVTSLTFDAASHSTPSLIIAHRDGAIRISPAPRASGAIAQALSIKLEVIRP